MLGLRKSYSINRSIPLVRNAFHPSSRRYSIRVKDDEASGDDIQARSERCINLIKERASILDLTQDQKMAFDSIDSEMDTFICGQAGSGKSTAYLLPLVYRLLSRKSKYVADPMMRVSYYSPRVILLSPTVALAQNLFKKLMTLHPESNSWTPRGEITQKIPYKPDPDVFVCTPLQMLHITKGFSTSSRQIILNRTELVIFDEADAIIQHFCGRSFAGEFRHGVRTYPDYYVTKNPDDCVRRKLQRVYVCTNHTLDKGTVDPGILRIPEMYMEDPAIIFDKSTQVLSPNIEHSFKNFESNHAKLDYLYEFINSLASQESTEEKRIIIFCRSDSRVLHLWKALNSHLSRNDMYGEICLDITERNERGSIDSIEDYLCPPATKSPVKARILISSDIYSRGIDFSGVSEVIHFDFALTTRNYIHRCGRTGRFGQKGKSTSLILESEKVFTEGIMRFIGSGTHEPDVHPVE